MATVTEFSNATTEGLSSTTVNMAGTATIHVDGTFVDGTMVTVHGGKDGGTLRQLGDDNLIFRRPDSRTFTFYGDVKLNIDSPTTGFSISAVVEGAGAS